MLEVSVRTEHGLLAADGPIRAPEDNSQIESLEPEAASLRVFLRGSSGSILLDRSNQAATLAEYLTSQKPLATYLSTVALIGSTILTILTRLKFIKPKD